MADYSKQMANAISAMSKGSAKMFSMLTNTPAKRPLSVGEILDIRYDIPVDLHDYSEDDNYLWAENCGVRINRKTA